MSGITASSSSMVANPRYRTHTGSRAHTHGRRFSPSCPASGKDSSSNVSLVVTCTRTGLRVGEAGPSCIGAWWWGATQNTLRFAWHLTTVAWWGFAALLVLMTGSAISTSQVGQVVAIVFGIHFLVALVASRGRHLSWIVFLFIAVLTWTASC